jgi:nucleotide-binding universal stress UspA family protein
VQCTFLPFHPNCFIIPPAFQCRVSTNYIEEIQKKNFAEASALLHRYRRALLNKFGGDKTAVPVELVVGKGDARDEIVDYIDSVKADLLVIGSRGLVCVFKGGFSLYVLTELIYSRAH